MTGRNEQAGLAADRVASGWRWMLAAAAAYNLVIGIPGIAAPDAELMARTTSLLVACFGLLYALIAWQPARLGPALWPAVAGKAGIVALILPEILAGRAPPGTSAIIAGDALFGLAFLAFLLSRARKKRTV
ncbi:hypothetical protein B5C34_14870 [Pacificimonas flava]|uniref:Uncharacterized protein n=2 Tax=Pacificimonas TaxID=1960290 RepID=A0A219B0F2_9SPHN|nr:MULTISPECIES: hypothetical protein [Pacificimonas]MBZ6379754.1 hypothetical protein [Pacificimonas aurantium]OWV31790.1 hypothetical protein B5C34_14870 [Pacificimonas flava]